MSSDLAWRRVLQMEDDVLDIARWGGVLHAMGSTDDIRPECLRVVAAAISDLGSRLELKWEVALSEARSEGVQ